MADDDAAQSALNQKRQELEEIVEPADHLVEHGASLLGDSAVLLGGLVDAVCDGGREGSVHALRRQVAYLRWKVNAQHATHERLRSMIEDLFEAAEMRELFRPRMRLFHRKTKCWRRRMTCCLN